MLAAVLLYDIAILLFSVRARVLANQLMYHHCVHYTVLNIEKIQNYIGIKLFHKKLMVIDVGAFRCKCRCIQLDITNITIYMKFIY